MSFAMTAYVVDLDVLHASVASRDAGLLRRIGARFERSFEHFDDQFGNLIEAGGPTTFEAVRAVIDGGPFDPRFRSMYGYAYKWICEYHGRVQDANDFSPMRAGWLEEVDEGLSEVGVSAVRLWRLEFGGPPAPIPSPDDVPRCGTWRPEQCRKAVEEWAAATEADKGGLDLDVRYAVESAMGWCASAARAGQGVIGFVS